MRRYVRFRLRYTSLLSSVPGPSYPLPLLGNLWGMLGPMEGVLDRGNGFFRIYGPGPIKFWMGEIPSVQVAYMASYSVSAWRVRPR